MADKDTLHIAAVPGVEPEAQPVTRNIELQADVKIQGQGPQAIGTLPFNLQSTQSAEETARAFSSVCSTCKHFDLAGGQVLLTKWYNGTASDRKKVEDIFQKMVNVGLIQDRESAAASMKQMGVCRLVTEKFNQPGFMPAISNCSEDLRSASAPWGLWEAKRDGDVRRAASRNYDAIMLRAAGRIK